MGHKKRAPHTADAAPLKPAPRPSADSVSAEAVKAECDKALLALRRGNHTKALRLMKDACPRYDSSPLFHRIHGMVFVKVAALIDDPSAKLRHLRSAIGSAKKAAQLSPNSIEFAHFHANLLYEAANDGKEYEEVVQECERALAIPNPSDPAKECLQDESQQRIATAEARVAHVQQELRALIQKSNIASISSWMKTLNGVGEEKFRVIPMRRLLEDPLEVRPVQTVRRPNEIKKVAKTSEERRKEIEVRVAAARLMQQNAVTVVHPEEELGCSPSPPSSSGSQRLVERQKKLNARKLVSSTERMDQVKSYWNSMTAERRRAFFEVRVEDVRAHFLYCKDSQALDCLSEALLFMDAHGTWKFWVCFKCSEKFADAESHRQHVEQEHLGSLAPALQSILPQAIDGEWVDMLVNGNWKPIDVDAMVKMLEDDQAKEKSAWMECEFENGIKDEGQLLDHWSSRHISDSSKDMVSRGNGHCNGFSVVKGTEDVCKFNSTVNIDSEAQERWPVVDDSERSKLLKQIHGLFESLVEHKCLSPGHLANVLQLTMDEIHGLPIIPQLVNLGIDRSPVCIRFLGANQLPKVVNFLKGLSKYCGLGKTPDKTSLSDDSKILGPGNEYLEELVMSSDSSSLHLNERLFLDNCVSDNSEGPTDNGVERVDASALVSWLFAGLSCGEQLAAWNHLKEEKSRKGMVIFQMLDEEFRFLQKTCERKCERLSYEEAMHAIENLCLEEQSKRETGEKSACQSYVAVLKKHREELIEQENDVLSITNRFELSAINDVLKEAQTQVLNANQFGYDEPLSGVSSHFFDLECGVEDDWRMQDYVHPADTYMDAIIQGQKKQITLELGKIDARILRNIGGIQKLEQKLGSFSMFDYRGVILPLIKSFMRSQIEALVDKDATEKSDAVREAFLAELARDAEKIKAKGAESSKNSQEKQKDKKKNKDCRRHKDSKSPWALTCNGDDNTYEETEEQISSLSTDTNYLEPEISYNQYLRKQEEEEFRRKIELEEEERKLEETLEYQRRIENEAKQRHLEERHKRKTELLFESTSEETSHHLLPHEVHQRNKMGSFNAHSYFLPKEIGFNDFHLVKNDMSRSSSTLSAIENQLEETIDKSAKVSRCASNHSDGAQGGNMDKVEALGDTHFDMLKNKSSDNVSLSRRKQVLHDSKLAAEAGNDNSNMPNISTRFPENGKESTGHCNGTNRKKQYMQTSVGRSNRQAENAGKKAECPAGENEIILRHLHPEDDDDEKFQADLQMAVSQSLDTFQAQKELRMGKSRKLLEEQFMRDSEDGSIEEHSEITSVANDALGAGLQNEAGEYNCFLNVIIQSLWHLHRFHDEFMHSSSMHMHIGNPCVVCALCEIFNALNVARMDNQSEPVAPGNLRSALCNLYPESNFFQEGQMNDASEVLAVLFDCLHRSFTSSSGEFVGQSLDLNVGHWDCTDDNCLVHTLFGMDVYEKMNCCSCGTESRHLKYTSFFYNINANALRMMKITSTDSSFDELLRLVEMNPQLPCDVEAGGCGKLNYVHHILSTPPQVFTTVLGWQNTCESVDAISATLSALSTQVDVGVLFGGLDQGKKHSLVSVVCYYGQHYHCFAYNHEHEEWIMYDDKTVKKVGGWDDVLSMCVKGHLQPQVLFYESRY